MAQIRNTIRPVRLSDAGDIYEMMHMPNVLWGTARLPSETLDVWKNRVEAWLHDEQRHIFVVERQEKAVGIVKVQTGKGRRSHSGGLGIAVHDQYAGQGVGKMLMITAIDLADNWLNLVRLELTVYTDNERAIHLYQQFDFEIEGRKRFDAFRGGSFIDSYMMARLHPRYRSEQTHGSVGQSSDATGKPE